MRKKILGEFLIKIISFFFFSFRLKGFFKKDFLYFVWWTGMSKQWRNTREGPPEGPSLNQGRASRGYVYIRQAHNKKNPENNVRNSENVRSISSRSKWQKIQKKFIRTGSSQKKILETRIPPKKKNLEPKFNPEKGRWQVLFLKEKKFLGPSVKALWINLKKIHRFRF